MNWPANDDQIIDQVVLPDEGGFVDDPADPGGVTNMGVTLPALEAFRGRPCTPDDIRNLQRPEAHALYKRNYIEHPGFDKISDVRVRTAVVDMAVLFGQTGAANGVEEAARALENIHGLPDDAFISDEDARQINVAESRGLILALSKRRVLHHIDVVVNHPERIKFLKGWTNRAFEFPW